MKTLSYNIKYHLEWILDILMLSLRAVMKTQVHLCAKSIGEVVINTPASPAITDALSHAAGKRFMNCL